VIVHTTTDLFGVGRSLALGGIVTAASITIQAADRITVANRRIVAQFTTVNTLTSANTININLPAGFISALTSGTTANSGLTVTQALVGNNIILTPTADIAGGAKTVTICGVTLGTTLVDNTVGVTVTTSKDYTATCSATGTVGTANGVITDVSMTIPFADRVAAQAKSAVFAFTTSANIPAASCGSSNDVVLTVPANFFATSGTAVATGITGYTAAAQNLGAGAQTITLRGTGQLTAGKMTVTISGLTLGSATVGNDQGVTVGAPGHTTSAGVPSGPISGYQVTKVTVEGTCQTSTACRTVTIGVSSAGAASTIAPGGTLQITGLPFSGTPYAMLIGGALVTSSAVSSGTITLTVDSGSAAWSLGATTTITLSGLTLTATSGYTTSTISVGGSTSAYSATYVHPQLAPPQLALSPLLAPFPALKTLKPP